MPAPRDYKILDPKKTLTPFLPYFERLNNGWLSQYEVYDTDKKQLVTNPYSNYFDPNRRESVLNWEFHVPTHIDHVIASRCWVEDERCGVLVGRLKNSKFFYLEVYLDCREQTKTTVSNKLQPMLDLLREDDEDYAHHQQQKHGAADTCDEKKQSD